MKQLSILIADDDESIRAILHRCVLAEGHKVTVVANGREATDRLARQRYDLVITDVLMPERDGLDLIAQCKKSQPTARILAISGGGRIMESGECLKLAHGLGAHAAIMKPFTRDQLLEGIALAMAPKRESGW